MNSIKDVHTYIDYSFAAICICYVDFEKNLNSEGQLAMSFAKISVVL